MGEELTIKAAYKNGDDEDKTFYPIETLSAGKHILNLFYPIQTVASNSARQFKVFLSVEGGTVKIGEGQIRATASAVRGLYPVSLLGTAKSRSQNFSSGLWSVLIFYTESHPSQRAFKPNLFTPYGGRLRYV